jgi:hypothetical protein
MSFFKDLFGGSSKSRTDIGRGEASATSTTKEYGAQARAADERMTNRSLEFLAPGIDAGKRSRDIYESALGTRGADAQREFYKNFQSDPGFQTEVDYGNKTLAAGAAKQGYLYSGRALQEMQDFGQTKMRDAFERRLTRLEGEAGRGDQAATGAASLISGLGSRTSTSLQDEGNRLSNIAVSAADARAKSRFSGRDLAQLIGTGIKAASMRM